MNDYTPLPNDIINSKVTLGPATKTKLYKIVENFEWIIIFISIVYLIIFSIIATICIKDIQNAMEKIDKKAEKIILLVKDNSNFLVKAAKRGNVEFLMFDQNLEKLHDNLGDVVFLQNSIISRLDIIKNNQSNKKYFSKKLRYNKRKNRLLSIKLPNTYK